MSPIKSVPALKTVAVDLPVEAGDIRIKSGGLVVTDHTGVVVVPARRALKFSTSLPRFGRPKTRSMSCYGQALVSAMRASRVSLDSAGNTAGRATYSEARNEEKRSEAENSEGRDGGGAIYLRPVACPRRASRIRWL